MINNKIKASLVMFLMIAVAWNIFPLKVYAESGAPGTNGETSGDWYIEYEDSITRRDENLTINGNLIINASGTLELYNINLTINSTATNRYYILVKPGGTLILYSTTIQSYNENYPYEFIIEGNMYMKNCTINNLWGSPCTPKGGIQVYSDVEIVDSTINCSSGTGIYINQSNPVISNNNINYNYYGIYFDGPQPTLFLSPKKVYMITNRSIQFNVSGGTPPYTWESSNTTVGTINSTGVFTSNNTGGSIIKVNDQNNLIGKAIVIVTLTTYMDPKIVPSHAILNVNDKLQFNATNATNCTQSYNWSVDNTTYGSIDQNGTFTAHGEGISNIKVSSGNNTTGFAVIEIESKTEPNEDCLIINNNLSNNQVGIALEDASPELSNNTFFSNNISIKFINSSSFLIYCEIENSSTYDFWVDSNSSPKLNFTNYNWTKISAPDGDSDSMPDYFEAQYGLNQSNNDSTSDPDSDGLSNLDEFKYCTDPQNPDTDSDGNNDYNEIILWNTNPLYGIEYLTLNKDLIIDNGQTLKLSNSIIIMKSDQQNTYKIYVKSGGNLYLSSSEISSYDSNYPFDFKVEGYLEMTGCSIEHIDGDSVDPEGIQLYTDSKISRSEIIDCNGAGIYIYNCKPEITNNIISDCYYGIYIEGSSSDDSTISNNEISDCDYGLYLDISSPDISENEFEDNDISISFENSNSKIDECIIINSNTYDLEIDVSSSPTVEFTKYDYTKISATDTDTDGIPDWYEDQYGLDKFDPNDATSDPDLDGLTNLQEYQHGTNPNLADTDSDGLTDSAEINIWGTDPLKVDTDSDYLTDYSEIYNNVFWFEAEDNVHSTDGTGVIDSTANDPPPLGNDAAYSDTGNGEIIEASLQNLIPGKYFYYVKARLTSEEPTDLKIKYFDTQEHFVTKKIFDNNYRWYKYDSTIDLMQNDVILRAQDVSQTGRIYVDKGVFLKVSDTKPWTVTTTDDPDDTIQFSSGGGEITVNLYIPIEGDVKRYVTEASMNIRGVTTETGKGLVSDKKVAGAVNEWNNLPDIAVVEDDTNVRRHIVYQRRVDTWDEVTQTWSTTKGVEYQTSTDGSSWSQKKYLDAGDAYYGTPTIDAYEDNVHAAFAKLESNKYIYYRRNLNDGDSTKWKSIRTMSDTTDSHEPNIDVDGNNVNVIWYDDSDGYTYYSKSSTDGRYWEIDKSKRTEFSQSPCKKPDVEVDSSNVHIVYTTDNLVDGEIIYSKLANNGETVISSTQHSETGEPPSRSAFISDSTGCIAVDGKNIHVVWVDYRDQPIDGEIYYKRSTDNGRTWGSDTKLSNSPADSIEPCIAVDEDHNLLYVLWSEYMSNNYEIHYVRSGDDGETWSLINEFTTDDDIDSRRPKAVADENGDFHVVYYDDFDGPVLGPPPEQTHDYVYYNYLENDIPTIPDIDIGNDDTIDYEPGIYEVKYPMYDFSKEINEYIRTHVGQIVNGYINVPLSFISSEEGTFELLDINVQLGPDISDVLDPDTDADIALDGDEFNDGRGLFHPEYSFKHFASSPAVLQYKTASGMESKVLVGGEGLFSYDKDGSYEWRYWSTDQPHIATSPSVADYDADGNSDIIFGSIEGIIYCLDKDKNVKWTYDMNKLDTTTERNYPWLTGASFYSSPAMAELINNDGKPEIIMVNYDGHVIRIQNPTNTIKKATDLTKSLQQIAEWEEMDPDFSDPTSPLSARKDHAIASQYLCSILFGGHDGTYYKGDTWVYDYNVDLWAKLNPQGGPPSARSNHAMAPVYGFDKHVLFGGEGSGPTLNSETWVHDLDEDSWTQMNPQWMPNPMKQLSARKEHAMATICDSEHVLLFGGEVTGGTLDGETWRYNFFCDEWFEETPTIKPSTATLTARKRHAMASVWGSQQVVMFGGRDSGGLIRETWVYDHLGGSPTWTDRTPSTIPSNYPSARENHAMATIWGTDKVILYGGIDGSSKLLDDTWVYDVSDKSWTKMNNWNKDPPKARENHAIATIYATGDVLLFGGDDGSLDDGTWLCELQYHRIANTYSSPVIGDIDDDDISEIIICDNNGKIYCLDKDLKNEWIYITDGAIKSTPAVGDINRDGKLEIAVGSDDGKIYCLKHDGTIYWSSPFNTYLPVRSSPSIANVDISTQNLEIVIGSDNGIIYCLKESGELDWQFPEVGEDAKGSFKASPASIDLNSPPDGGYEVITASEDGHIYSLDTVGAIDSDYSYFSYRAHSSIGDYSFLSSIAVADIDNDKDIDIILGPKSYKTTDSINSKDTNTDYDCPPGEIKWGMMGAGTRHDGRGDNRYTILVQGSNDIGHARLRFRQSLQQSYKLFRYTGYYLDDQIFYIGYATTDLGVDRKNKDKIGGNPGLPHIQWAVKKVKIMSDSYDTVSYVHEAHGGYHDSDYWFDASGNDKHNDGSSVDLNSATLSNLLKRIICQKSIVILSGCKSGGFISKVKQSNRIVSTATNSARRSQGDWDLWWYSGSAKYVDYPAITITDTSTVYIYDKWSGSDKFNRYDGRKPFKDWHGTPYTLSGTTYNFAYKVTYDRTDSDGDKIYAFDTNRDGTPEFYEDRSDICSEYIGGLIYALKKKWFDPSDSGEDPTKYGGINNGYISINEAFVYSKKWDAAWFYEYPQINTGSSLNSKHVYLW
jgi:parallel beta-helix repeat protein